jgi:GNAT superfamily N-acetyltransferase
MLQMNNGQNLVQSVVAGLTLPANVTVRAWTEADFADVQRLSRAEGWPTPITRPQEALTAWRQSWPALVAADGEAVIGFLRALTDGAVTMYIAELLVDAQWRGRDIGYVLLDVCHRMYPSTRIDLLSTASAESFYEHLEFRRFRGFRKSYS